MPDDFFTSYIDNPLLSMLIVLAASIPLYVCATGSVPIAVVLIMKGLSPGAALVFLMAGPATNIATITVLGNSLGRKTLLSYLFSIIGSSIFFGVIIDYFFDADFFVGDILMSHGHKHLLPEWFKTSSSIVLGLLILNGFFRKYFFKKSSIADSNIIKGETIIISVKGMTCNKCKASVEMNLKKIDKLNFAEVNLNNQTVEISMKGVDIEEVKRTVDSLGYKYKCELNDT